jgi:hypothetical protein
VIHLVLAIICDNIVRHSLIASPLKDALKRFNPRYLAELPFVSLALVVASMREGHNRI